MWKNFSLKFQSYVFISGACSSGRLTIQDVKWPSTNKRQNQMHSMELLFAKLFSNGKMEITHRIRTLVCIYTDFESAAVVEYLRDDHGKLACQTK